MVSPYYGLYEAAVINTINAFAPCVTNFLDESNQPFSIPMRAEYAAPLAEFSEVVVSVRPGTVTMPIGDGVAFQETDNTGMQHGVRAQDSLLVLTVKARSPAERFLVVDALMSGFLAGFVVSGGVAYEAAVRSQLMAAGIIAGAVEPIEYTPANEGEERPEGQVYQAEIALRADIWLTWKVPPYIANQYRLQTSLWGSTVTSTTSI